MSRKSRTNSSDTKTCRKLCKNFSELNITHQNIDECASTGNSHLKEDSQKTLKFITWNADGLNRKFLFPRIRRICKIISDENADIVFLQEIVEQMLVEITNRLPNYKCISGRRHYDYFVVTLLKSNMVTYVKDEIHTYRLTNQGRNLLEVEAKIGNIPIVLLNTHLESTGEGKQERSRQLRMAFNKMKSISNEKTVIFGGDLNLRDNEFQFRSIPGGIEDMWEVCGKEERWAYTWDGTINDNLEVNYQSRLRFDRVYLKQSTPPSIQPADFRLIGMERLPQHKCFPSDHWGIFTEFRYKD